MTSNNSRLQPSAAGGFSRRDIIRLAAAATLGPVLPAFTGVASAEPATQPAAGVLIEQFRYADADATTPRLLADAATVRRSVGQLRSPDARGRAIHDRLRKDLPDQALRLRKSYQARPPGFMFSDRSMLLDCVVGHALLEQTGEAPDGLRENVIGAAMDLVDALRRSGKTTRDLHVGQASNMLPLAVAYDWLYPHLTAPQRQAMVAAMRDYSFRPTLEALYGFDKKVWWIAGLNNWTTICIGGAMALALALRQADEPGEFDVQTDAAGTQARRTLLGHADALFERGLANLSRCWGVIDSNNGLWGEGPGYQHDAMLPLYLLAGSLESARTPGARLPLVDDFLADARRAATKLVQSSLHLASTTGEDLAYSDGNWTVSEHADNLLIADFARRAGGDLWRAAVWQADRGEVQDPAFQLLYRGLFDFDAAPATPRGMNGYRPTDVPTAVYFFDHKAELPNNKTPVHNPHVAVWRQSWGDPHAAVLMFKGGDNRSDAHSHLDVGTFLYEAGGVRWAIDLGPAIGYPIYRNPDAAPGTPQSQTLFQSYQKRACGHNTLVLNPADNDYAHRRVPKPWDWLWQVNPDQSMYDLTAWCGVVDLRTDAGQDTWSAAVDLAPAYARHGLAAGSRRRFDFDRNSGAVTIHDDLTFKTPGNEAWWFMHLPAGARLIAQDGNRLLLTAARADATPVYLDVSIESPAAHAPPQVGPIDQNLPAGVPDGKWLWGSKNAAKQIETLSKLSARFSTHGTTIRITARLTPRPEWAGYADSDTRTAWAGQVAADRNKSAGER